VASPARLAGVGLFVMSGLLLFAVGLFMIGDRQMAFAKKFIIYTQFTKITGLQPGAIVRVSGAKAGSITEIFPPARPSDKFKVKLEITEDLHQIVRNDSIASIETEGLVGGTFLAISGGSDQSPTAPAESIIPSREPFEIADLLQQMNGTITKVNDTIDLLQADLLRATASIADTVENADKLITDVSADVKTMASAGARIGADAAEITEGIRKGEGTLGKLVKDDELYNRVTSIAKKADDIATDAKQVVEQARKAITDLQAKDGPVQGVATNLKQTLDDARLAMSAFAENMEALKHNFLVRGFFNQRGYFNLASISPAEYRQGALNKDGKRSVYRVWLSSSVIFERDAEDPEAEQLTDGGKARLDSAVAPYLDRLVDGVLMVEGYATDGTRNEQYVRSRIRAAMVREYLVAKFHLEPQAVGLMPLGSDAKGSPNGGKWDGIAVAAFLEKDLAAKGK
jgi:phospholipid/cholesterol/gamma-HCH transport system substrate-binding protein